MYSLAIENVGRCFRDSTTSTFSRPASSVVCDWRLRGTLATAGLLNIRRLDGGKQSWELEGNSLSDWVGTAFEPTPPVVTPVGPPKHPPSPMAVALYCGGLPWKRVGVFGEWVT